MTQFDSDSLHVDFVFVRFSTLFTTVHRYTVMTAQNTLDCESKTVTCTDMDNI